MPATGLEIRDAVFAIVDVETTGLTPEDRITEVAALRLCGDRVIDRFQSLVNPGMHIPMDAAAVSGIDDAMVADAPAFPQVWPAVERVLAGAVLVAHNAPFDLHFLSAERKRAGLAAEPLAPVLDTLRLARNLLEQPRYSLAALGAALQLEHAPAHRAMADVLATAALLQRLIAHLPPEARSIDDLLHAQDPVPVPWEEANGAGLAAEIVAPLREAVQTGTIVVIAYAGRAGVHRFPIRPIAIEHNGPLYYLRAVRTAPSEEPAVLRLDRIQGIEPAEA